jgi:hypothetical protein
MLCNLLNVIPRKYDDSANDEPKQMGKYFVLHSNGSIYEVLKMTFLRHY